MSSHVEGEALPVCTTYYYKKNKTCVKLGLLEARTCQHQNPQVKSQDAHLHDDVESLAATGRPNLACCIDNGAGRLSLCRESGMRLCGVCKELPLGLRIPEQDTTSQCSKASVNGL